MSITPTSSAATYEAAIVFYARPTNPDIGTVRKPMDIASMTPMCIS